MVDQEQINWLIENVGPVIDTHTKISKGNKLFVYNTLSVYALSEFVNDDKNAEKVRQNNLDPDGSIVRLSQIIIGDGWQFHFLWSRDFHKSYADVKDMLAQYHFITIDDENQALIYRLTWR